MNHRYNHMHCNQYKFNILRILRHPDQAMHYHNGLSGFSPSVCMSSKVGYAFGRAGGSPDPVPPGPLSAVIDILGPELVVDDVELPEDEDPPVPIVCDTFTWI
eukprot:90853_1